MYFMLRQKILTPGIRPYRSENLYKQLEEKEKLRREVRYLEDKAKGRAEKPQKKQLQGSSRSNSKSGGLTFSEKKRLVELKHILSGKSNEKEKPTTAQRTITFEKMFRDGICQVSHRYYTKMVEFYDINYELLEVDDQADILAQYSKLINYFDPSVKFELVLFNRQVNEQALTEQFDIPRQEDDFNDIREEYTEMLKKQAAKGNNGIIKSKYLILWCGERRL